MSSTGGHSASSPIATASEPRLQHKTEAIREAVARLDEAQPFAKARYQTEVYRLASELLDSRAGIRALLDLMPEMIAAGVFHGGPWERGSRLLPGLVGHSLRGEGVYPTLEALSELRMLAIVVGSHEEEGLDPEKAERFLQEVCVQNLDLMFPESSEESRARPKLYARAERLFSLIREHISATGFGSTLIDEVETICAQRPLVTRRVERILELARQLPEGSVEPKLRDRLDVFLRASGKVTAVSASAATPGAYQELLARIGMTELSGEARDFARSLHRTGLCSPYHVVLIRHLAANRPELLAEALGLSAFGAACLDENHELVSRIVDVAIFPGSEIGVLGLAGTLDRGLLSRPEIRAGMRRLLDVDMTPTVARRLEKLQSEAGEVDVIGLLIAGTVSVLGLPLGIGQGNNPTCQAARGLSLWSQHAPGLLLKILVRAVRHDVLHTSFEHHDVQVRETLDADGSDRFDLDLDPVSAVLVPLLDGLYARLLALTQGRPADPHRWVNPAMYGNWVPGGFAAAFEAITGAVVGHLEFVRLFFATHHPAYNGGYDLLYPNPVGIILTDVHGNMLGYHAVSIQRVGRNAEGQVRVFFFNPNNEGRQRWGGGVSPTVTGNSERPGESSLPFEQFASRLYAFHFDPYEKGQGDDVPRDTAVEVSNMARATWGRSVVWADPDPSAGAGSDADAVTSA